MQKLLLCSRDLRREKIDEQSSIPALNEATLKAIEAAAGPHNVKVMRIAVRNSAEIELIADR
jgi:hypothetical protein